MAVNGNVVLIVAVIIGRDRFVAVDSPPDDRAPSVVLRFLLTKKRRTEVRPYGQYPSE